MNYMAVKIASEVQRPDAIKFWIDGDPVENKWWDRIKPLVQICRMEMPDEYRGVKIVHPQYRSDVTRLQILHREGGVYLDTDMFLLEPLDFWVKHVRRDMLTASKEPGDGSVCNALMISPPGCSFVETWLDELPKAMQSSTWAEGGVNVPYRLAEMNDKWANILGSEYFCPLDLSCLWLFDTDPLTIGAGEGLTKDSFSIHGYETYWRDYVGHVTPEWTKNNDCLFSRKFARHLEGV
jgi:Glycosyltransferase sugar-binding region containing DXD motif